jgi:Uma2 family endonuclease
MGKTAREQATYADIEALPEHVTGEIIDGELIATPRPAADHGFTASVLGVEITAPFQLGRGGGPGGWIILDEVEIRFGEDLLVPDLSGWRRERFPGRPQTNWLDVPPDWVCEILSPSTSRKDRVHKMRIYARHSVSHAWLVDPAARTLEVFRLQDGKWLLLDVFADNDLVRAEPFEAVELTLGNLWMD